jgi:hypothetical protein
MSPKNPYFHLAVYASVMGALVWGVYAGAVSTGYNWDWHRVPRYLFAWEDGTLYRGFLIDGLLVTLQISAAAFLLMLVFGLAAADAEPIAVVSGPVASLRGDGVTGADLTLELLAFERSSAGIITTVSLRTDGTLVNASAISLSDLVIGSQNYLHALTLEDPDGTGLRYRPLQFDDGEVACICPYLPFRLGPEPTVVSVVFPLPGPEAETVDLLLGDTGLVVADLAVPAIG